MKEYAVNNNLEGNYYIPNLGITHGHVIVKKYILENMKHFIENKEYSDSDDLSEEKQNREIQVQEKFETRK